MSRPTRARIHLPAFQHNLQQVRNAAAGRRVWAVIKANGYGHGILGAAAGLQQADGFAVASLEEALVLRDAGIDQPILLLEGIFEASELTTVAAQKISVVVHHEDQLAVLERAPGNLSVPVWVKLDTGMHRIGFPPERAADAWQRLQSCEAVAGSPGLMTHLANADDRDDDATPRQLAEFAEATTGMDAKRSMANSAGVLGWPEAHGDWVRPGIMLYGICPFVSGNGGEHGLQPAMTLSTKLIAVNRIRRGEGVGYGGTWVCPEDMDVGVAAIGYGDGYPRHAPSGTPVLVNGQRVPLVGRVSMDMITVDLRTQPAARPGDSVVLWGEGLPVEEIASQAGTIGYELVCGVTPRVAVETTES